MALKTIQKNWALPKYRNDCFSNIPSAIQYLFGIKKETPLSTIFHHAGISQNNNRKVVLFLVDGFGYRQWTKYTAHCNALKRLQEKGNIAPLTAVFPSTTAAALTTIHSGLTPQEHGLPEWWVYFEELNKTISTLLFTAIDEDGRDKLLIQGISPKILFDGETIYQQLAKANIPSSIFMKNDYLHSAYSSTVHSGSKSVGFLDLEDLFLQLKKAITKEPSPGYFFVYWDAIDAIGHHHGPHSSPYIEEVERFFCAFDNFSRKLDAESAQETVFLFTADHGQIKVDPSQTIYLDRYPNVMDNLQVNPQGDKIFPWGSPRDIFLAIKDEKLNDTVQLLSSALAGKATVLKIDDALRIELFGQGPLHRQIKSRLGNLLVLPHDNLTIWYEHPEATSQLTGMHGGLHEEEMLVPFVAIHANRLLEI